MSKSYFLILIIVLLVALGLIFYFHLPFKKPKIGPKEAVLIIDFGKTKRAFKGEVIKGMTILDALITSAKAGKFDFEFDYQKGILKRVGEFKGNGKKWKAYLNGVEVKEPLNKIPIKAGDEIRLKFE